MLISKITHATHATGLTATVYV